jgi:hypothetical protein
MDVIRAFPESCLFSSSHLVFFARSGISCVLKYAYFWTSLLGVGLVWRGMHHHIIRKLNPFLATLAGTVPCFGSGQDAGGCGRILSAA